ncbi:hypothetical protein [Streptomyces sp. UNOB3_S3]|uniref:hypothetical protein n=1 Tax=Streptomyces sp. UNOB3_S3 TaxID=2871682 RepID=UPI001E37C23D|nr:hypothetical protein [Streptomyces sp. UNOB3_S3]MCC3776054.1 hypothetical protein [Streptomyces sp. UNOB3_S3]
MPAWTATVLTAAAVALLAAFVVWGVRISPNRPFSWGMYSGSSKGYLWSGPDDATVLPPHRLLIAPSGHYLTVPDLRNLLAEAGFGMPLRGLIVGSDGGWQVEYDPVRHRLRLARLPAGQELRILADALRTAP